MRAEGYGSGSGSGIGKVRVVLTRVMFILATPAKWKVLRVICVPGKYVSYSVSQ